MNDRDDDHASSVGTRRGPRSTTMRSTVITVGGISQISEEGQTHGGDRDHGSPQGGESVGTLGTGTGTKSSLGTTTLSLPSGGLNTKSMSSSASQQSSGNQVITRNWDILRKSFSPAPTPSSRYGDSNSGSVAGVNQSSLRSTQITVVGSSRYDDVNKPSGAGHGHSGPPGLGLVNSQNHLSVASPNPSNHQSSSISPRESHLKNATAVSTTNSSSPYAAFAGPNAVNHGGQNVNNPQYSPQSPGLNPVGGSRRGSKEQSYSHFNMSTSHSLLGGTSTTVTGPSEGGGPQG